MCIFCEIGKGNINSYKVYEDDKFLAFLDLSQETKGHTLIIPKDHYENIFELGDVESKEMINVVKKVGKILKDKLHCDGINVVSNAGEVAGQTVMHCHIHLLPQYKGKEVKLVPSGPKTEEAIEEIHNLITK